MSKEVWDKIRGMVRRVTVKDIKDDGETQTASIEVADGIWRTDVEILQQYGISSSAPEDGAVAIALALGGDEGDMVVLPVANPSKRLGGLQPKDAALYNAGGDLVVVRAGGGIEVKAASSVTLSVSGVSLTIDAAGFHFAGGGMWHDGVPVDKTHVHKDVVPGAGNSGVPVG